MGKFNHLFAVCVSSGVMLSAACGSESPSDARIDSGSDAGVADAPLTQDAAADVVVAQDAAVDALAAEPGHIDLSWTVDGSDKDHTALCAANGIAFFTAHMYAPERKSFAVDCVNGAWRQGPSFETVAPGTYTITMTANSAPTFTGPVIATYDLTAVVASKQTSTLKVDFSKGKFTQTP